jgi:hypothetical protein
MSAIENHDWTQIFDMAKLSIMHHPTSAKTPFRTGESMAILEVSQTTALPSRSTSGQYLTAFAVWLPIGFIGASGVVVGAIQYFGSDTKPLSALALAVVYGLLAAYSWRRAQTVLGASGAPTASVERPAQSTGFYRAALGTHVTVPD